MDMSRELGYVPPRRQADGKLSQPKDRDRGQQSRTLWKRLNGSIGNWDVPEGAFPVTFRNGETHFIGRVWDGANTIVGSVRKGTGMILPNVQQEEVEVLVKGESMMEWIQLQSDSTWPTGYLPVDATTRKTLIGMVDSVGIGTVRLISPSEKTCSVPTKRGMTLTYNDHKEFQVLCTWTNRN